MSSPNNTDARVKGHIVIDTVLTLGAWVVFFWIARGHVTSDDPRVINIWGALTAACMAGVFWFAWQMFRVVYRGQREDAGR